MKYIFTSEAVTEGHPDKVADRIADAILDKLLEKDKYSRVACEVTTSTNLVHVFGEITSQASIDYEKIVRDTVKEIGYTKPEYGFSYDTLKVLVNIDEQSRDIALGVDEKENKDLGAGDQGIMFGFASNETVEACGLGAILSEKLAIKLAEVRKNCTLKYLRPDGKTQVSIEYDDNKPVRITCVLVSAQHDEDVSLDDIRRDIKKYVIDEVIPSNLVDENTKYLINPTGRFVVGGPMGDTGLTGRKIIVDTYGGYARHGGGSFSGKDATKVDRSASYYLRYIAKNMVMSGLCDKIEIQSSYAIGVSEPISIYVNSYGTSKFSDEELVNIIKKEFNLTPKSIINELDLRSPRFYPSSCYGHFGRNEKSFTWERLDRVDSLKKYLI